jgi:hypothetical protein
MRRRSSSSVPSSRAASICGLPSRSTTRSYSLARSIGRASRSATTCSKRASTSVNSRLECSDMQDARDVALNDQRRTKNRARAALAQRGARDVFGI